MTLLRLPAIEAAYPRVSFWERRADLRTAVYYYYSSTWGSRERWQEVTRSIVRASLLLDAKADLT